MADNFDFDGSIFENDNNPQNSDFSAQDTADSADGGAFSADDNYGDYYTPASGDTSIGDLDAMDDISDETEHDNTSQSDDEDDDFDDIEERGIRGFLDSIGGKGKIYLIVAVALLLIFLIVFLASGRNAKKNSNKPVETVSIPQTVEITSEVPVTTPVESQTLQLSGGLGTYTVDTGDNTLALRPNASTDYDAIVRLKSGTVVEVLFVDDFSNTGESWGYIVYEEQAGWVNMEYLVPGTVEVSTTPDSLG